MIERYKEYRKEYTTAEWTTEDWAKAWTIQVGRAYTCSLCDTMIMVTKGGVGALEPICCNQPMKPIEKLGK